MPPPTKVPKGTRDLSPLQAALRTRLFETIIKTFRKHGADEIDTPVFELKETLVNKYGEDSKLIFDLAAQGGEALSLRYDLTVPLARYVAAHKLDLIKRFHIAKVYRRDNPAMSRGRFREFYQCDFDICGAHDVPLPDVECAQIVVEILTALNLAPFKCKISHRKILFAFLKICNVPPFLYHPIASSIDKMDKTPYEQVKIEMINKGLTPEIIKNLEFYIFKKGGITMINELIDSESPKSAEIEAGLKEIKLFFEYAQCLGIDKFLEFDLSLARGLDYYTGVIFEFVFIDDIDAADSAAAALTVKTAGINITDNNINNISAGDNTAEGSAASNPTALETAHQKDTPIDPDSDSIGVGSIAGGGRYDDLIGSFKKGHKVPAVGISIGVERLLTILEKKCQNQKIKIRDVKVLVSSTDENLISARLSVAKVLWDAGIPTEMRYKVKGNTLRDFQYCETHLIPYIVIVGQDEFSENCVVLRNMSTREQAKVPIDNLVEEVQKRLTADENK